MVDPDGTEYKQTDRSRRGFSSLSMLTKFTFPQIRWRQEFQVTGLAKGTGNWRIDYRGGERS